MFRVEFNFTRPSTPGSDRKVSDAVFRRKLARSDTLRHMCGFDSELYDAINAISGR